MHVLTPALGLGRTDSGRAREALPQYGPVEKAFHAELERTAKPCQSAGELRPLGEHGANLLLPVVDRTEPKGNDGRLSDTRGQHLVVSLHLLLEPVGITEVCLQRLEAEFLERHGAGDRGDVVVLHQPDLAGGVDPGDAGEDAGRGAFGDDAVDVDRVSRRHRSECRRRSQQHAPGA